MHKIREITVGVCYVDSILEKAEEAVCTLQNDLLIPNTKSSRKPDAKN